MWPDAYIDWAKSSHSAVVHAIQELLSRRLSSSESWTAAELKQIADFAMRVIYDVANEHRRYSELFRSELEFQRWAVSEAIFEVIRLLVQHRLVEPLLPHLPAVQRQVLVMAFVDRLPIGDLAGILQIGHDEVRRFRYESLNAFFQLLKESGDEMGE